MNSVDSSGLRWPAEWSGREAVARRCGDLQSAANGSIRACTFAAVSAYPGKSPIAPMALELACALSSFIRT